MRNIDAVNRAVNVLINSVESPKLSGQEKAALYGMLIALRWVAEASAESALQRLVDGEPLELGRTMVQL